MLVDSAWAHRRVQRKDNSTGGGGRLSLQSEECLEDRAEGLCVVDLASHTFAAPNVALPESIRGVFWIDAEGAGEGTTNPWVDFGYLAPFPAGSWNEGKFWVLDATPGYQSWEDVPESIPYVSRIKSMGTRSVVAPDLTVTWSFCGLTCGTWLETWTPLPVSSPSEKIGENEYIRKMTSLGVTLAEWKAYRIIDAEGERTEFFDKMLEKVGGRVLMLK